MTRIAAVLLTALALAPQADGRTFSDCCFRVRLPTGWSSAVGPGVVAGKPAAYILVADFPLRSNAAMHEAPPAVPAGKALIALGDFPVLRQSRDWRRMTRLRLPPHGTMRRVTW